MANFRFFLILSSFISLSSFVCPFNRSVFTWSVVLKKTTRSLPRRNLSAISFYFKFSNSDLSNIPFPALSTPFPAQEVVQTNLRLMSIRANDFNRYFSVNVNGVQDPISFLDKKCSLLLARNTFSSCYKCCICVPNQNCLCSSSIHVRVGIEHSNCFSHFCTLQIAAYTLPFQIYAELPNNSAVPGLISCLPLSGV